MTKNLTNIFYGNNGQVTHSLTKCPPVCVGLMPTTVCVGIKYFKADPVDFLNP